jgi:hypothetical protein
MIVLVDYASPSNFDAALDQQSLGLAVNRRRPVQFSGFVREHCFILRIALRALGEAIWSEDAWVSAADLLDPVITVHPDRIFFEAFSQDQSTYACLIVDPQFFDVTGEVVTGTTNIDFTAWLWGALGEMRTSRQTRFSIGAEGMAVTTAGAGGRFERKVDLPQSWVRGFLQVQAAMALPGTRLSVRPVDLLSAIRWLRYTKARVSPRALRYEFEQGQDARLVLEPWEHVVTLHGAGHNYMERKVTRVWGRRRLKLIEGLLPFADGVTVYLKGRALPSFYAVQMPGMTFVIGLTGFSASGFTGTGGFDLTQGVASTNDALVERALDLLRQRWHASLKEIAAALSIDESRAAGVLVRLCRQGRCMFDVESRRYRHRELFEQPASELEYFPPDERRERADAMIVSGSVRVDSCAVEETTKIRNLKSPEGKVARQITYRDWRIAGQAGKIGPVEITVNNEGQIIFGRCKCPFFEEHLLNRGPCEHMLALVLVSEPLRIESASSQAADAAAGGVPVAPSRWEIDSPGKAGEAGQATDDSEEDQ